MMMIQKFSGHQGNKYGALIMGECTVTHKHAVKGSYSRDGSCSAGLRTGRTGRTGTQRTKTASAQIVHWEFPTQKGKGRLVFPLPPLPRGLNYFGLIMHCCN